MTELKLRAFSERFNRGSDLPLLAIGAEIAGENYVISVEHATVSRLAFAVAWDERGQYALVEEFCHDLPGGLRLCLRAQLIDGNVVGAELCLEAREHDEETAAGQFTVFFNEAGLVDGQALVRLASEFPATLH